MTRGKERPWMIEDREVSKREFKLALLKIIQILGEASPTEVADHLNIDMTVDTEKRRIWNIFEGLQKSQRIFKVARGKYKVSPQIERLGINKTHQLENEIVKLLRENGGILRQRDILEAFDLRPHGDNREMMKNDWRYTQIRTMLLSGPPFYTHLGRGIYCLGGNELQKFVLLGRWVKHFFYSDWWHNKARWLGSPTPFDKYERCIEDIGAAFSAARLRFGKTYEDVATDGEVYQTLVMFAEAAERCKNHFIGTSVSYQIRDEWNKNEETKGTEISELDMHIAILRRFEEGETMIHDCAPLEFYTACADLYKVCPLSLSRGAVIPVLPNLSEADWDNMPAEMREFLETEEALYEERMNARDAERALQGLEEEVTTLVEQDDAA
jgi:hypothetical protein